MALCQYKVGYLSLKGCGDPAVAHCRFCSQAVCARHMRSVEGQSACLSCYVERSPDQGREEEQRRQSEQQQRQDDPDDLERERMRRDSYDHYGYSGSGYRSRSYSTFDDRTRTAAAAAPLAAGDFQDS